MQEAQEQQFRPRVRAGTPATDAARFTITSRDVGTEAVRAGNMAELEESRMVLLLAAKLALGRIRAGNIAIGAPFEYALDRAIKMAEGKL
jgi:hypothetical protein